MPIARTKPKSERLFNEKPIAVIAAVMLTLRPRTGTRTQKPADQVRVKAGDRLRMVKMAAEVPQAADATPEVKE